MIDRLESRGLVERRMLPTDRRVKTVALTPLGATTKAELFTRLHEPPARRRAAASPARLRRRAVLG